MNRLREWWARQDGATRILIAVGVPLAAFAAIYAARRRPSPSGSGSGDDGKTSGTPPIIVPPVLTGGGVTGGNVDGGFAGDLDDLERDILSSVGSDLAALAAEHEADLAELAESFGNDDNRPIWWWRERGNAGTVGWLWQACFHMYDIGRGNTVDVDRITQVIAEMLPQGIPYPTIDYSRVGARNCVARVEAHLAAMGRPSTDAGLIAFPTNNDTGRADTFDPAKSSLET